MTVYDWLKILEIQSYSYGCSSVFDTGASIATMLDYHPITITLHDANNWSDYQAFESWHQWLFQWAENNIWPPPFFWKRYGCKAGLHMWILSPHYPELIFTCWLHRYKGYSCHNSTGLPLCFPQLQGSWGATNELWSFVHNDQKKDVQKNQS